MLLSELFEASTEVAIIFGRFNPPHKGHKAAWEIAAQSPIWYIGTNKSTIGPKDPLPYDVKIKAMQVIWPDIKGHIVAEQSWLTLCSRVFEEHGDVILNVVTDEEYVFKLIAQYNGVEGKQHGFYKFTTINPKPSPRISSATDLRAAVTNDNPDAFAKAAGVPADTLIAGVPYFELVKKYMTPDPKVKTKKTKEECAGVGIVTKQNSTADVGSGTIKKNMKAFKL